MSPFIYMSSPSIPGGLKPHFYFLLFRSKTHFNKNITKLFLSLVTFLSYCFHAESFITVSMLNHFSLILEAMGLP